MLVVNDIREEKDIAFIDIGTTKICSVYAHVFDGRVVEVLGVGTSAARGFARGIHKALVINLNEARNAVRDSINRAGAACEKEVKSAIVGVSARHVLNSQNCTFAVNTRQKNKLVSVGDIAYLLDLACKAKTPSHAALLHVIPRHYTLDDQSGIKNPVGMYGYKLEAEFHVVSVAAAAILNLTRCVSGLGLRIDDLVLNCLATGEAVLTPEEKEMGVILADIGGDTTEVAVFRDGSILHTSVLPIAGNQVTQDISTQFGLTFEVAETLKKKCVNFASEQNLVREKVNVSVQDESNGSYVNAYELVRDRIEELLRLILLEVPTAEYSVLAPAGLVLTGGTANLPLIANLARFILRIPVRIGRPSVIDSLNWTYTDPEYSSVAGLLLWNHLHLRKDKVRAMRQIRKSVTEPCTHIKH